MNTQNHYSLFVSTLLVLFIFTSCQSEDTQDKAETSDKPSYEVKGRFLSLNTNGPYISVVHEEIPDVMNAMRMNMNIKDIKEVEGISAGDIITFTLKREGMSWFVTDIQKLPDDTALNLPENLQQLGLD